MNAPSRSASPTVVTAGIAALVLRVYDLGEAAQTADRLRSFTLMLKFKNSPANGTCRSRNAGHSYVADLGLRWPDGKFVSLFRSNVIRQPVGRVSDKVDSQWMSVGLVTEQRSWEDMARIAIGVGSSKGASGSGKPEARWRCAGNFCARFFPVQFHTDQAHGPVRNNLSAPERTLRNPSDE